LSVFRKSVEKVKVSLQFDTNSGTLWAGRYTFLIISRSVLLRIKTVWEKGCRENQNTPFMFSNFFSKNRVVCEVMWKNTVEPDRPQMAIKYGACALHAG
jgi:hypothetical protein